MTNEIHADDVIGVELVGGDVHIHLISREPVEAGSPLVLAVRRTVVMPLEGFPRTFAAFAAMAGKLVEAGVAAPADERPADGASLAAERPSRPVSRTTGREAWVPAGHLAN